jgi:hypothetical protein
LAASTKGQVKIAYWDTEQPQGRRGPPALLGEVQGTPTIRLYKPKKKQKKLGSHADKIVVEYRQERKLKELQQFVEEQMPNYVERVTFPNDMAKLQDKATKYGLPQAILFTSKPKTTAVLKYLSTEFRRRLLLVQVPPTKKNELWMQEYGVTANDLPALIIVTPSGERIRYAGADFSRRKLERFLSEHANPEATYKPIINAEEETTKEATEESSSATKEEEEESQDSEPKQKVHVEL